MGSFDLYCSVSGLPIKYGTPVVYLILSPKKRYGGVGDHLGGEYFPRCLPVTGEYNDYGWLDKPGPAFWLERIRENLLVDGWVRHTEWPRKGGPARYVWRKANPRLTMDEVQDHLWRGDLRHKHVDEHFASTEGPPDQWKTEKDVRRYRCIQSMIRQDVWDALLALDIPYWDGKKERSNAAGTLSTFREADRKTESKNKIARRLLADQRAFEEIPHLLYHLNVAYFNRRSLAEEAYDYAIGKSSKYQDAYFVDMMTALHKVHWTLFQLGRKWGPNWGGPQNGEFSLHHEFATAVANMAWANTPEDKEDA